MNEEYLVINYIEIEKDLVVVGATDSDRWSYEKQGGASGADAKTIVWVYLKGDLKSNYAIEEEVKFYCPPGDDKRDLAMKYMPGVFELAWDLKKLDIDFEGSWEKYFGHSVKS